jgi:hypothetical protein
MDKYKQNLTIQGDKVISYTTHVATINRTDKTLTRLGWWGATTSKHINYVAEQMNLTIIEKTN